MPTLPLCGRLLSEGSPKHRQVAVTRSKMSLPKIGLLAGTVESMRGRKQAWPLHSTRMLLFYV